MLSSARMIFGVAAVASVAVLFAGPSRAATLSFSGGANPPPTDVASYLRHVYCARLPPGGALRNRDCRAVLGWMTRNGARPRAAWTPPPILD